MVSGSSSHLQAFDRGWQEEQHETEKRHGAGRVDLEAFDEEISEIVAPPESHVHHFERLLRRQFTSIFCDEYQSFVSRIVIWIEYNRN